MKQSGEGQLADSADDLSILDNGHLGDAVFTKEDDGFLSAIVGAYGDHRDIASPGE